MDTSFSAVSFAPPRRGRREETLRLETSRQLIWLSTRIYLRHFFVLFLVGALPPLAADIWYIGGGGPLLLLAIFVLTIFGSSGIGLTVADICRGNQPSIRRTYQRLLSWRSLYVGTWAIVAALLIAVVWSIAFGSLIVTTAYCAILLAIPLTIVVVSAAAATLLFVPVVAAVEENSRIGSVFKRSIGLGRGHRGRLVLFFLAFSCLMAAVSFGFDRLFTLFFPTREGWIGKLSVLLNLRILFPLFNVAAVLIYFDLRVRKEGFSRRILVQELSDD